MVATERPGISRVLGAFCALSLASTTVLAQTWTPQGPAPTRQGQVEGIVNGEVAGAVNAVAPHPTDANIVYIAAVNGGIWKSTNAMAVTPTWVRQTDFQASLTMGALEFDPTDASNQTLLAGNRHGARIEQRAFATEERRPRSLHGLRRPAVIEVARHRPRAARDL